jgi:hypothetical protein
MHESIGGRKKLWLGVSGEAVIRCSKLAMDFYSLEE